MTALQYIIDKVSQNSQALLPRRNTVYESMYDTEYTMIAYALILHIPNGDPRRSQLFIMHFGDSRTKINDRVFSSASGNEMYWACREQETLWLSPSEDRFYPDAEGIEFRDGYLRETQSQNDETLCRLLIDMVAQAIPFVHQAMCDLPTTKGGCPILLDVIGGDQTLSAYAARSALAANPPEKQTVAASIYSDARYQRGVVTAVSKAHETITRANNVANIVEHFEIKCRRKQPVASYSELTSIEQQQYRIIKDRRQHGLFTQRRGYVVDIFKTCRAGLLAFQDVKHLSERVVFCVTQEEYARLSAVNTRCNDYAKAGSRKENVIRLDSHYFEEPNIEIDQRSEATFPGMTNYSISQRNPISERDTYVMEYFGHWYGVMAGSGTCNLWKSDAMGMYLLEEDCRAWRS